MGYRDKDERLVTRLGPLLHAETSNEFAQRFTLMLQPVEADFSEFKEDYEYEFEPLPQKYDPVMTAIRSVMKEICFDNLRFANAGVRVYGTTSAPPIWPHNACEPGHTIKFYTFTQEGLEFPMTVPITVMPRFGTLRGNMLFVEQLSKWTPLKEWLLTIPHYDVGKGRTPFQMTRTFWQRNGRSFRFLDLPLDIRNIIYEHVIGWEIYPLHHVVSERIGGKTTRRTTRVFLGEGYTRELVDSSAYRGLCTDRAFAQEARRPVYAPNFAILRVNRQVHDEALRLGWTSSVKCFLDDSIFLAVASAKVGPLLQFNCLNKLQLNFTHRAWLRFFGVTVTPRILLSAANTHGRIFRKENLPKLAYLELRFRIPEDGYDGNP